MGLGRALSRSNTKARARDTTRPVPLSSSLMSLSRLGLGVRVSTKSQTRRSSPQLLWKTY